MSVPLGIPTVNAPGDPGAVSARVRTDLHDRAPEAPLAGPLLDRFGRVGQDLRISLIDKCNLRCTYCMPADGMAWLPKHMLLTIDEVARLVRIGVDDLGVRELRLTGGEPLVRRDLEDIIARVHAEHPDLPISITTNAIGLDKRAAALAAAGLTRINVSLDSIDADTFAEMTRRNRLQDVLDGIDAAHRAGLAPVKINAVLMKGLNDDQAPDLLEFCLERDLELRFIEQMPLDGDHGWTRDNMVTAAEMRTALETRFVLVPDEEPRGGAPAERWAVYAKPGNGAAVAGAPDASGGTGAAPADLGPRLGTVGIIASVTEPFCGACTRTRITAEGRVRSCLFSHEEFDLAAVMRAGEDDAAVSEVWRRAMWLKPRAHGMDHTGLDSADYVQPERSMSAIGG